MPHDELNLRVDACVHDRGGAIGSSLRRRRAVCIARILKTYVVYRGLAVATIVGVCPPFRGAVF